MRPPCLPPRSAARAASRCLRRAIAVRRLAGQVPGTRPRGTIWRSSSLWGLNRTGFVFTDQGASQALLSRWSAPRVRRRAAPDRLRHRHQAGPAHPDPPRRTSRTPAERSRPRATGLGYPARTAPETGLRGATRHCPSPWRHRTYPLGVPRANATRSCGERPLATRLPPPSVAGRVSALGRYVELHITTPM